MSQRNRQIVPIIWPYMCASTTAKKSHEDFVNLMELFDLMYTVCISEEKLTSKENLFKLLLT